MFLLLRLFSTLNILWNSIVDYNRLFSVFVSRNISGVKSLSFFFPNLAAVSIIYVGSLAAYISYVGYPLRLLIIGIVLLYSVYIWF